MNWKIQGKEKLSEINQETFSDQCVDLRQVVKSNFISIL